MNRLQKKSITSVMIPNYDFCVKAGYTITTQGIEQLETVWENGVRYFKIAGPSGEEVEFCQIL